MSTSPAERILAEAAAHRDSVGGALHDKVTEAIYTDAVQIADRAVARDGQRPAFRLDRAIDQVVTSRVWGFPIMALMLTGVFWLTIAGANVPSALLGELLTVQLYGALHAGAQAIAAPAWLAGLLIDGVYLATAWVVSVMLPPMAIFFPLFTLLEDLGYLPRVAFNLDRLFKGAGAHGTVALDDDGLGLQRGRGGGHADHRQPARAADRDHHQQLQHLQRALADAHPDGHALHRRHRRAGPG